MKNKKGQEEGGFGHAVGIAIAVLIVGIVAYIVIFYSIPRSTSNILEPLKKLVGIETKKAEASTTNTNECIVKRYYWSKNSAKIGENIAIIVEGSGNCNDKKVKFEVYSTIFYEVSKDTLGPRRENKKIAEFQNAFNQNIVKIDFNVKKDDEDARLLYYYFIYEFGNDKQRSENLGIIS